MNTTLLSRCLVLAIMLLLLSDEVRAQDPNCTYEVVGTANKNSLNDNASVPTQGQYRALVVYVRFKDDNGPSRDWPVSLTAPPSFAAGVIASNPNPASYSGGKFPEKSITRYFYDQSNPSNRFILYGDVYPSVIVTDNNEYDYYQRTQSGASQVGGFGFLTLEVLNKVDPNVNFADYDRNGDGQIDYLFIVIRANPKAGPTANGGNGLVTYSGVSHLEERSGTISNTDWGTEGRPNPTYDGKSLNWANGSFIFNHRAGNIIPELYHPVLWAHEIGHDLWEDYFVHLPNISTNDVPIGPPAGSTNNNSPPTFRLGYTLMAGGQGTFQNNMAGNETISAYERSLLN